MYLIHSKIKPLAVKPDDGLPVEQAFPLIIVKV
jgi:hypothetical protein